MHVYVLICACVHVCVATSLLHAFGLFGCFNVAFVVHMLFICSVTVRFVFAFRLCINIYALHL